MPKSEEGPKHNSRFRGEKPERAGAKSPEFKTFTATIVELAGLIRKSPDAGFEELNSLLSSDSDDSEKEEGQ